MSRSSGFRIRSLRPPLNVPARTPSPTSPSCDGHNGQDHSTPLVRTSPRTDARRTGRTRPAPFPQRWRIVPPWGNRHGQGGGNRGVEPVTSPRYVAHCQAPAPADAARTDRSGRSGGNIFEVCGAPAGRSRRRRARHGRPRSEPNGGGGGGGALRGRRFAAIFALWRAFLVLFRTASRSAGDSFSRSSGLFSRSSRLRPQRVGARRRPRLVGVRAVRGIAGGGEAAGAMDGCPQDWPGPLALPVHRRVTDRPQGNGHDQPGRNQGVEHVISPRYVADSPSTGAFLLPEPGDIVVLVVLGSRSKGTAVTTVRI